MTLHVRTATEPEALLAALRREAQALDATLPVYNLQTLAQQKDGRSTRSVWRRRC